MAFAKKLVATTLIVGGTLGSLALINKVTEQMAGELDTVLNGEERRYPWKYGDIFYKVKGAQSAKPLVLIHGLGPGASSYEWRKNIDALSTQFRVFALDLLGFGLSERPPMDYDAELYADLLSDFIKEVIGTSAVVVAHGATSAYAIAAAYRRRELPLNPLASGAAQYPCFRLCAEYSVESLQERRVFVDFMGAIMVGPRIDPQNLQ